MSGSNATTPPPILIPDPATVIGPIFIGNMINWMLMGTLIVQVYVFYVTFIGERLAIQLLVYTVFILDIIQTIFGTHQAWFYSIANWNNGAALLGHPPWSAATIPIMCGLISAIVQIFYAWRIWTLKHTLFMRAMAILIVLIAISQCITAIVASAIIEGPRTQQELLRLHPAFSFWLAGSFVADILVTGCMIWILYDAKSRTAFRQSERLINRLTINVIQTGTATVICAGVDLALFVSLTSRNYHLTPAYILGKLYSNSLMVTLNARRPKGGSADRTTESGDTYGMRVHVSRETQSTAHYETQADQWPGVKLSQLGNTSSPVTENNADVGNDASGRHVQVVDLNPHRETDANMA